MADKSDIPCMSFILNALPSFETLDGSMPVPLTVPRYLFPANLTQTLDPGCSTAVYSGGTEYSGSQSSLRGSMTDTNIFSGISVI